MAVLVASQNVRVASPPGALAQSVLNGDSVLPNIVNDGGQQSFLDARRVAAASEDDMAPSLARHLLFWMMLCQFGMKIYHLFLKKMMKS